MGQLVPPEHVFPESKMGTAVSLKAKPQKSLFVISATSYWLHSQLGPVWEETTRGPESQGARIIGSHLGGWINPSECGALFSQLFLETPTRLALPDTFLVLALQVPQAGNLLSSRQTRIVVHLNCFIRQLLPRSRVHHTGGYYYREGCVP